MTKNKYSGEYTLETNIKYTKGLVNIFFAGKEANPFTGNAYALQFGDSSNIKLFRFAGDDIKTENMGKNINDGNYHNIKITKTTNSVVVYVDGTEYLSHTFDTVEDFYNNAHAGIGLWDGALEVQGFKKAPDEGGDLHHRLQNGPGAQRERQLGDVPGDDGVGAGGDRVPHLRPA